MRPQASFDDRRQLELLDDPGRTHHQLMRLNALLAAILPHNRFYREKLSNLALPLRNLEELSRFPFTVKQELAGGAGDRAQNLTWPVERYVRFHRTSGTHGRPVVLLDTAEDWEWWLHTWQFVLDAAEVTPQDRVFMAFSFGPFVGFWSAHDAITARGALTIPGGGLSTLARLELICSSGATLVCCTPSYALHLAETAGQHAIDLPGCSVDRILVAGEPGGSIPEIRDRIEAAWGARVIDHAGATEVGPWGYADRARGGLHVNEAEFIAEVLQPGGDQPVGERGLGELVLTNLGRCGAPVIRYRTGDLVRASRPAGGANRFLLLEGGVLGRADDMLIIRGVNVIPSSVESILRSFPEIIEYRVIAAKSGQMDALRIEVEDHLQDPMRVIEAFQSRLGLRVDVACVPLHSLPRFEGKGRRFQDAREETTKYTKGTKGDGERTRDE